MREKGRRGNKERRGRKIKWGRGSKKTRGGRGSKNKGRSQTSRVRCDVRMDVDILYIV